MDTVKLRNGSVEAMPVVNVVMVSLRRLFGENPTAFYELVMKARNPDHQFWGNAGAELQTLCR